MVTSQQLFEIDLRTKTADPACVKALNDALAAWKIANKQAVAALIGMVMGESGGLHRFSENLNYTTEVVLRKVFPSFFAIKDPVTGKWVFEWQSADNGMVIGAGMQHAVPAPRFDSKAYLQNPQKLANLVYANRYGNGSEESGDGWRYRGMGAIQLTFKAGILAYFKAKGIDPKTDPASVLTKPAGALDSAAWYFVSRGCDKAAITGGFRPVYKICQPSMIGLDQHEPYYLKALEVL